MKYFALTLPLFILLSFHMIEAHDEKEYFPKLSLEQEETEKAMSIFLSALNTGDKKREYVYRENEILWYNVNRESVPDTIKGSLSTISFLHLASFPALEIKKEERKLYRIFYSEQLDSGKIQKHRYVFHINERNKIDEILYLPPPNEIKSAEYSLEEIEEMIPMGCAVIEPRFEMLEIPEEGKNKAPEKNKKLNE